MMGPTEVLLIPYFVTLFNLGLIDTYAGLVVPWTASVFAIFILRQFFLGIRDELSYAAKVDGCSEFKFLWYVMVPLTRPAVIMITLLKVMGGCNASLCPLIVTNAHDMA